MTTARKPRPDLITRAEAPDCSRIYGPDWHAPLPTLFPGMVVKLGIRAESGTDWPWARVRRVLDKRIWVTVEHTASWLADEHGVEGGEEIEVRSEELHLAWTPEQAEHEAEAQEKREVEFHRLTLASASGLFRDVDRHLALDTLPTRRELEQWAERLEVLAEFLEPMQGGDAHLAIKQGE